MAFFFFQLLFFNESNNCLFLICQFESVNCFRSTLDTFPVLVKWSMVCSVHAVCIFPRCKHQTTSGQQSLPLQSVLTASTLCNRVELWWTWSCFPQMLEGRGLFSWFFLMHIQYLWLFTESNFFFFLDVHNIWELSKCLYCQFFGRCLK